jgi:hypothetical protein
MRRKPFVAAALGGVSVLATGGVCAAPASLPANAEVEILEQIVITEDFNLDFGTIDKPQSGTQSFTVNTDNTTSTTGTGSFQGGHQRGQYDISGSNSEIINLTLSSNGCAGSGGLLLLTGITSDAGLPVTLDVFDLHIGGTLAVSSAAVAGSYGCTYSIQANYD